METNTFIKVNAVNYAEELLRCGVEALEAAKFARVLARPGIVGEEITTYVSNGTAETVNTVKLGKNSITGEEKPGYVITMATAQGEPIVDSYGHTNTYIIPAETFEKKLFLMQMIFTELQKKNFIKHMLGLIMLQESN